MFVSVNEKKIFLNFLPRLKQSDLNARSMPLIIRGLSGETVQPILVSRLTHYIDLQLLPDTIGIAEIEAGLGN